MMPFGERLSILKKSVVAYLEEKISQGAYYQKAGDLIMVNGNGQLTNDLTGGMRLKDCALEKLCSIADKIHFKPLEHMRAIPLQTQNSETEKTEDMSFEIKKDIPLPGKFAEKKESIVKPTLTPKGRVNYSNLPLRAMKRGECIVLFEKVAEDKISSRKYSAITGIRRISAIMGLSECFHVDILDKDKIAVWRVG